MELGTWPNGRCLCLWQGVELDELGLGRHSQPKPFQDPVTLQGCHQLITSCIRAPAGLFQDLPPLVLSALPAPFCSVSLLLLCERAT